MNELKWNWVYWGEVLLTIQTCTCTSTIRQLHKLICLCACVNVCMWWCFSLRTYWQHCMLCFLLSGWCFNVIVPLISIFHRRELGLCAICFKFLPHADTMAVFLQGPHFLPSEWWMMSWVSAKEGPPLPVVSPHLHNSLFERPCC